MASFYVYVVKLDNAVQKRSKFLKVNPDMDRNLACYYVGQTVHKPEDRFKQHKQGGMLANAYVRDFGEKLCPELFEKYNPIPSRDDAMELEGYLAERLREKGHGVWVN